MAARLGPDGMSSPPLDFDQAFHTATGFHARGRLDEAERGV